MRSPRSFDGAGQAGQLKAAKPHDPAPGCLILVSAIGVFKRTPRAPFPVGVAGLFIETRQDADVAQSDGLNMVHRDMTEGLQRLYSLYGLTKGL